MQARKTTAQAFLILSAIVLLTVLSWHPAKRTVRMRKPSAAVEAPAVKMPTVPQAPTSPSHSQKTAHAKVAAQAQAAVATQGQADVHSRRIVVSLEDRRLALVEDGQMKQVYRVAVGKDSTPSPVGTFTIVKRVENPTYYHDGKTVPPGPGNPVGTRWMGLSKAGYGIHGTNAPRSIGRAASHGCIRMARPDLENLFAEVHTGDTVEIVGTRDEETIALFGAPAVRVSPAAAAAAPTAVAEAAAQFTPPATDASAQGAVPAAVVAAAVPLSR
jgi:lipoprotein-anchoring transpeptidase ErfK/SrfK